MAFINDTDHFDQHFLVDENVIKTFIEIAHLSKEDIVVEIGPGKGNITNLIAPKVAKLYCIELDERLKPDLLKIKVNNPNVELIFGSALDVFIPKCDKIITSLPYSIIEPFMNKLTRCEFNEAIMIVGSNFASGVINNESNHLSLLTNCFFKTEKIMEIIPDAFIPKPRVLSAMVKITPVKEAELNIELLIFRLMFKYPSQKIKNALMESLIKAKALTKRIAKEKIKMLNIPNDILDKKFEVCTNEDLETLYHEVEKLVNLN
jgi:16S rRNA (adenine1518-N6/adenine1519-N6)-dimethyltransferase